MTLDLAGWRLHRQHIAASTLDTPAAVARWMGAMQAQDYPQALFAIGVRAPALTAADVERALAAGSIVRTWSLRGTIHWMAAEDVRWMVQLVAARLLARDAGRRRQLELDDATLERCGALFHAALRGGKRLARAALLRLLEDAGIRSAGQRGYHILWNSAYRGLICTSAADEFALLDEWTPPAPALARDEALAALARRYFTSHGPAMLHDFATWAALNVREARTGLDGARAALVAETLDGKEYWLAADASAPPPPANADVHLLPGYDEYLLGYSDRRAVLDPQHAAKVSPGGNGVFYPMVVADGQIVGTWKRAVKKQRLLLTRAPFAADVPDAALAPAAQRFGAFWGMPAEWAAL